ncbi:META domain-containing protein [Sorangium sp. So ce269]
MRTSAALSFALCGLMAAALLACSREGPSAPPSASPAPRAPSNPQAIAAASGTSAAAGPPSAGGGPAEAIEYEDVEDDLRAGVADAGAQEVPPQLVDRWELREVRYKNGRASFVPQYYGGFRLRANGSFNWSDGCNHLSTSARVDGNKLSFDPGATSTLVGCSFAVEDVHYPQATHYKVEDRTLYLHTPSQIYVLERFPYSKLSLHAWSLHSIKDRHSGKLLELDRFRREYHHFLLRVEKDTRFHFTDLDREEFTGSLQVEGGVIRGMAYDQASKARLRARPEQSGYLPDTTRDYKPTTKKYPTTYAQRLDWEAVTSFKVLEGTRKMGSEEHETEILELHSDKQIYRFIPR